MRARNLNYALVEEKNSRPVVSSYDASYEHSLQHYAHVRAMVEEAENGIPGEKPRTSGTFSTPSRQACECTRHHATTRSAKAFIFGFRLIPSRFLPTVRLQTEFRSCAGQNLKSCQTDRSQPPIDQFRRSRQSRIEELVDNNDPEGYRQIQHGGVQDMGGQNLRA